MLSFCFSPLSTPPFLLVLEQQLCAHLELLLRPDQIPVFLLHHNGLGLTEPSLSLLFLGREGGERSL